MCPPGQGREAAKRTLDAVGAPFTVDVGEWGHPGWENRPVARKNDRRDAELLRALGHKPRGIEVKPSAFHRARDVNTRSGFVDLVSHFRFACECGYTSTWRQTEPDALQAGVHHMRKAAAEYRRNGGVSLPEKRSATG